MSGKAKSADIPGGIPSIFNVTGWKISRQDVHCNLFSGSLLGGYPFGQPRISITASGPIRPDSPQRSLLIVQHPLIVFLGGIHQRLHIGAFVGDNGLQHLGQLVVHFLGEAG